MRWPPGKNWPELYCRIADVSIWPEFMSSWQRKAAKRGTIANFASHLELLRKLLGAPRQMVLSSYRNLVAKYSCLF